jgi:hypothetical protein
MKLSKRTELISMRVCPELLKLHELLSKGSHSYSLSDYLHKKIADEARHSYKIDYNKYEPLIHIVEDIDTNKRRREAERVRKKHSKKPRS